MRKLALFCLLWLCIGPAWCQTNFLNLSWLEGRWVGDDQGFEIVEVWLAPSAQGMMGICQTGQPHREFIWLEEGRVRVAWPTAEGVRIREFGGLAIGDRGFSARGGQPEETLRYNLLESGELEITQGAAHRLLLHRQVTPGLPPLR